MSKKCRHTGLKTGFDVCLNCTGTSQHDCLIEEIIDNRELVKAFKRPRCYKCVHFIKCVACDPLLNPMDDCGFKPSRYKPQEEVKL